MVKLMVGFVIVLQNRFRVPGWLVGHWVLISSGCSLVSAVSRLGAFSLRLFSLFCGLELVSATSVVFGAY